MAKSSAILNPVLSTNAPSVQKGNNKIESKRARTYTSGNRPAESINITLDIDYEMDAASPRKDNVKVTYDLALTMVDQKVINTLTETASTMRCYICKATPK